MNQNMSMYKPDWQEARQRMINWWEGKKNDRVVASVTSLVSGGRSPRKYISDAPAKYLDFETVFNNLDYMLETSFWGAEAFPRHNVYFGPMFHQTFLGSEPAFSPTTTWYEPCYESLDELVNLDFDRNNKWWKLVKEMVNRSVQRADGRYLTNIWGIAAIIDTIAGLIGNEKSFLAMMEEPEKLKAVRNRIAAWGKETYDELYAVNKDYHDTTIDSMGVYCHKKVCTTQCDLSVMISPDMFRDYVLEDIESSYAFVDYGIYHLDGEEQIRHLDILLSIEKLKLIQWQPTTRANMPSYKDPLNWIGLFKRIQDAGKSVLIYCPPEQVRELLQKIARDKVFLSVGCSDEKSAQQLIRELERIGI